MAEALTYKCPCCGAGLDFHSLSGKMKCAYCDSEIDIEELKKSREFENSEDKFDSFEFDGDSKKWNDDEASDFIVNTCSSCGGKLITDANTAATRCVYCGNPALLTERLTGIYKPDLVVPFKKTKDEAKAALRQFYKKKYLLPKLFKDENKISEITGMYVPFWLYDCKTDSKFTYKASRSISWSDSRFIYTKTDYFRLYRDGQLDFINIPADASKRIDDTIMESIEPFDLKEAVGFEAAYLSGYCADKYDETPDECEDRIKQRIYTSVDSQLRSTTVGYTGVIKESANVSYTDKDVKYALLPVWILNTEYKNKQYTFAMNGQTGKLVGNLPVDYKKFALFTAASTAIIGSIFALIGLFMM